MGRKKKHRIRESQTEVDNGVHPLHWATSPGPSQMGTDPINGFKMVQNGSGISETSTSATVNRMLYTSLQDLLFWKLQNGFQKEKKPNHNRV